MFSPGFLHEHPIFLHVIKAGYYDLSSPSAPSAIPSSSPLVSFRSLPCVLSQPAAAQFLGLFPWSPSFSLCIFLPGCSFVAGHRPRSTELLLPFSLSPYLTVAAVFSSGLSIYSTCCNLTNYSLAFSTVTSWLCSIFSYLYRALYLTTAGCLPVLLQHRLLFFDGVFVSG